MYMKETHPSKMLRLLVLLIFIEGFACVKPKCETKQQMNKYLVAIETKLTNFQAVNGKRLDAISDEYQYLRSSLDAFEATEKVTQIKLNKLQDDLKAMRESRPTQTPADEFTTDATSPSIQQALDALMTMLISTAISLNETRDQLQADIARLAQTTNNPQHHINDRKLQFIPAVDERQLNPTKTAINCLDGKHSGMAGIVQLQLTPASAPFYVNCEDDGWLVVMNRFSDNLNFDRGWLEYKSGFGNLAGEFFIGLEKLHALTASALHELRVELEDLEGNVTAANYNVFGIAGEEELYALSLLGAYKGNAGDSLTYHAGSKFSTLDNDNDGCLECNCADSFRGGWWFNMCAESTLMGNYKMEATESSVLLKAKMLIRPVGRN